MLTGKNYSLKIVHMTTVNRCLLNEYDKLIVCYALPAHMQFYNNNKGRFTTQFFKTMSP